MSPIDFSINDLTRALGLPEHKGHFLQAQWPAPAHVKTLMTTRNGGVSRGMYKSFNLGAHVGDDAHAVAENRAKLQGLLPAPVCYLNQTHSTTVVLAADALDQNVDADASVDATGSVVCAVMTADCLPVLFTDQKGSVVAAAHAGWRGLVGGVLENTVDQMGVPPLEVMAYLGAAIGSDAFEVGQDVWDTFCLKDVKSEAAFIDIGEGKYLADIYLLARLRLKQHGVSMIFGGEHCTVLERAQFFSYRREGQTGRMVSTIWLEK